jgi:phage terminase small subunit
MAKTKKDDIAELTDQQKRFADEYLVDYNGKQAAIRAGYSPKTAEVTASRLLSIVKVQEYLQSKHNKIANKLEISQERTMQEIGRIAFSDLRKYYDESGRLKNVEDLDDDAAAALSSLETVEEKAEGQVIATVKKLKVWDKTKGLEMLAKHFNIYSDAPVNNNVVRVGYGKEVD